jgi:hypothetical protein
VQAFNSLKREIDEYIPTEQQVSSRREEGQPRQVRRCPRARRGGVAFASGFGPRVQSRTVNSTGARPRGAGTNRS